MAAQIAVELLRATERTLGVDDPALLVKPCPPPTCCAVVEVLAQQAAGPQCARPARNLPRNRAPTGNKKSRGAGTHVSPPSLRPPPVTMQ